MRCAGSHTSVTQGVSQLMHISIQKMLKHTTSFEAAVEFVVQAGSQAFMAKEDFKSAFRNVPLCFQDLNLLGIKVKGQFFIDNCLPFGALVSCAVFEDISMLIHWIAERRVGHALIHYLDDFFTVHKLAYVCSNIMVSFKEVCVEIGILVSPEKAVGPVQVIQFLGMTIDTILMVVIVLEDKRADILKILTKMIRKRKATSLEIQALAGKLNFLCKVVPAGKPFIQRVYQTFAGVPQHRHIYLKNDILADKCMWKLLMFQYKDWQLIISNAERSRSAVELFMDAAGNPSLGWGHSTHHKVYGCIKSGIWFSFRSTNHQWFFLNCMPC